MHEWIDKGGMGKVMILLLGIRFYYILPQTTIR